MHLLTEITLNHYLVLSGALFSLGLMGILLRRNILIIYMCLEMMLNAGVLALVALGHFSKNLDAQIMVLFIITVAAAEVALGLAIITAFFRLQRDVDVQKLRNLKF